MDRNQKLFAVAGAALGVGAGLAAQHSVIQRRRRNDPEGGERFGERRGAESRYLSLPDGATIFIEETGPTDARRGVIFVHGSVLRTDVWHYQLPGIGRHRLVFYDLRGHGMSQPKGRKKYSIGTLADDLLAVIDDARLEEVVIVGHSIGGMVALQACLQRPDLMGSLLRGLVLTNTTHRPAFETLIGGGAVARLERFVRHPLDVIGSQHHRIEVLRKIIKPSDSLFMAVSTAAFGPNASAKQVDFTYDMLAETPTDTIFDLIKCYRDFDVTDVLGDINIPALVIGGTHDRLTVVKASEHLAENLPKSELKIFEGGGHMTMLERHREFNRTLEAFFNDILGDAGSRKSKA